MQNAENIDTLKNLNSNTAKFAKWIARIIAPKLVKYTFRAQNKEVYPKKFVCIIVSKDASQYMMAEVPFDFKNPDAADLAVVKFKAGTVWELTTPAFNTKAKAEYNGCPVKGTVLLTHPSKVKAVPPTNQADRNWPAGGLRIQLGIQKI